MYSDSCRKGDIRMALSKQRKQELVEKYTDLLQRSQGVVWVNNKGLSVSDISTLRNRVREAARWRARPRRAAELSLGTL